METAIINHEHSALDISTDRKLLCFSVLLSEKVYYISPESGLFDLELIKRLPLKGKLKIYRMVLPKMAPGISIEYYDRYVEDYFKRQDIKNKSHEVRTLIIKNEEYFRKIGIEFFRYINKLVNASGIKSVIELNNSEDGRIVVFPRSSHQNQDQLNEDPVIAFISQVITGNEQIIPVFDITVKNTQVYKECFSISNYDGSLRVSPIPILGIPQPWGYSTEQLKSLRNHFTSRFKEIFGFFNYFIRSKEVLDFQPYEAARFDMILKGLLDRKDEIQQAIDSQAHISYLRKVCSNPAESYLYPGFCSAESLLKIFLELRIINDNIFSGMTEKYNSNLRSIIPLLIVDLNGRSDGVRG